MKLWALFYLPEINAENSIWFEPILTQLDVILLHWGIYVVFSQTCACKCLNYKLFWWKLTTYVTNFIISSLTDCFINMKYIRGINSQNCNYVNENFQFWVPAWFIAYLRTRSAWSIEMATWNEEASWRTRPKHIIRICGIEKEVLSQLYKALFAQTNRGTYSLKESHCVMAFLFTVVTFEHEKYWLN